MSTNTHTEPEVSQLVPPDPKEAQLWESVCRPQNPGDPQEAMLREALAACMIMAQRLCAQTMTDDLMIAAAAHDGSSGSTRISPALTLFLRLMREIRAQDRFLRQYLKDLPSKETIGTSTPQGASNPQKREEISSQPGPAASNAPDKKQAPRHPPNIQGSSSLLLQQASTGPTPTTSTAKQETKPDPVGTGHASTAPPAKTSASQDRRAQQQSRSQPKPTRTAPPRIPELRSSLSRSQALRPSSPW